MPSILVKLRRIVSLRPLDTSTPEGRSLERYRRIGINSATGMAARGAAAVVNLLVVPWLLDYLGKDRYGLWAAITSIVAWVLFFDLGVVDALVNLVSQAHGSDNLRAMVASVSSAFFMLLGVASLLAVGLVASVVLVRWDVVLAAKGVLDPQTAAMCVAAAIGPVLISLPASVVRQVYAGVQRAYVSNLFLLIGSLLALLGVFCAVRLEASLPMLVLAFASGPTVASIASFLYLFVVDMPRLAPRIGRVSRLSMNGLVRLSVPLFLFQIGALLVNNTQPVIMAHVAGLGVVAEYSILSRLAGFAGSLIVLGTAAFMPAFREATERGEGRWTRKAFGMMLLLRMALAGMCATALIVMGNQLLVLWLGRSDVASGIAIWGLLGLNMLVATWGTAYSQLLTIMDRIWLQVGAVLLNGVSTIALTMVLVPRFGVLGGLIAIGFIPLVFWSWYGPSMARPVLQREAPGDRPPTAGSLR